MFLLKDIKKTSEIKKVTFKVSFITPSRYLFMWLIICTDP